MKRCIGSRALFAAVCLVLLGAGCSGTAEAGQKYTLRVSMVIETSKPSLKLIGPVPYTQLQLGPMERTPLST